MKKMNFSAIKKIPFLKEIGFGLANFIILVVLVTILGRLNTVAVEIKTIKNTELKNVSGPEVETAKARLEGNQDKIEKIKGAFVSDDEIVDFVKEIDLLKSQGLVKDFDFVSESSITDKRTGYSVLPYTIKMEGDATRINQALNRINKLPYLSSGVVIEIEKGAGEEGGTLFSYGGYLYIENGN